MSQSHVILGIDPGLHTTGYGVVEKDPYALRAIDYGVIRLPKAMKLAERLATIQEALRELVVRYRAEQLATETQFVKNNPASAMKLGMVRGVTLALAYQLGLPIYEYAPSRIKKAVTGRGLATKQQIQTMVKMRLELPHLPPEDAADALAMALCHLANYPLTTGSL